MSEHETDPAASAQGADRSGALGSVLAIALGAAAFWAARDYSTLGAVFPRAVGVLLMALGVLYLVFVLRGRTRRAPPLQGSSLRRGAVAAIMLGWGFALDALGFLPSSALAMALLLVVAHHERWSARTAVLYGGAAGLVLIALYALFKQVLLVPLP
jgi:putative tricarboxylic transport membrane protein